MVTMPPYLQPGDTVGLVCPGGYMAFEKAQACIRQLNEWGYEVKPGFTLGSGSDNYFSGPDEDRLKDFQQMLDDDQVKAVLCARGGYGSGRIIDKINFKKFRKQPKWIIGFSDITILHSYLFTNENIASLHAPMAGAFNEQDAAPYLQSARNALEGKKIYYLCDPHPFNRRGEAIGELVGGNLALLAHGIGSSFEIKTRGRILFIEDVGEYLYNIDRMLHQLKNAGKFNKLAGLIVGGFTEMKDTERPFGSAVEEIIRDMMKDFDFPVCFGFPVGHQKENLALKIGVGYKLKVGRNKTVLEE